jgi:hypothetical protein
VSNKSGHLLKLRVYSFKHVTVLLLLLYSNGYYLNDTPCLALSSREREDLVSLFARVYSATGLGVIE